MTNRRTPTVRGLRPPIVSALVLVVVMGCGSAAAPPAPVWSFAVAPSASTAASPTEAPNAGSSPTPSAGASATTTSSVGLVSFVLATPEIRYRVGNAPERTALFDPIEFQSGVLDAGTAAAYAARLPSDACAQQP